MAGDIIFFDWGDNGTIDHVGIVESVSGGTVNTIEGNSGISGKMELRIGSSKSMDTVSGILKGRRKM